MESKGGVLAMRPYFYANGGNTSYGVDIFQPPTLEAQSTTSMRFSINKAGMSAQPTSYVYTLTEVDEYNVVVSGGQVLTGTPTTEPFTVTGLKAGTAYRGVINAKLNSNSGNSILFYFVMPKDSNFVSAGSNALDPSRATASKSFLRINNSSKNPKSYKVAWKTFDGLSLGSYNTTTITVGTEQIPVRTYTSNTYYSFGTTMYLDAIIEKTRQSAGFGFFLDSLGTSGYYVSIDTTETAASENKKEVRILKVNGSDVRVLKDTQKNTVTSLNGVYGGRSYKIDVKVQVKQNSVAITAYINGFKISVVDSNGTYPADDGKTFVNKILPPTKQIGVFAKSGQAIFDYVYGTDITKAQYDNSNYSKDIYNGLFSNDFLDLSFGDIIYNQSVEEDNLAKPSAIDEFGTTVREIKKSQFIFNGGPSFPIKFSTGLNNNVKILGEKKSNFGGEVYVLNNSSALTPLSDQQSASFYIYGNTISPSGVLEYETDQIPEYVNQEPVIFDSKWLQNLSDVEALGKWIKSNIINRGQIIFMEIFGNPLISVGDIVTIKYVYQGLAGTEKFIVTAVEHNYNEGLSTTITCRTL
jgi:hypothetical protein